MLDRCPNCGSLTGYYQISHWYGELVMDWETGEGTNHIEPTWISKIVHCVTCRKGFYLETIEKLREAE